MPTTLLLLFHSIHNIQNDISALNARLDVLWPYEVSILVAIFGIEKFPP